MSVRALAYMTYAEYLLSPHWQDVKARALERAGNKCQVCSRTGELEAHHSTYKNIGEEEPEDVTILCDECHTLFSNRLPTAPEEVCQR